MENTQDINAEAVRSSEWLGPWSRERITEEGMYLTVCFTMGRYRYPRLMRVWRGPKSGRLYCDVLGRCKRVRLENEMFNCAWVKITSPSFPEDDKDGWPLGGEWWKGPNVVFSDWPEKARSQGDKPHESQ
jgi:hypothetical protein